VKEIFSNYGIEIVVGMIFAVLATLFSRVIYFSDFNKKSDKWIDLDPNDAN
jgi:hypothetical protein